MKKIILTLSAISLSSLITIPVFADNPFTPPPPSGGDNGTISAVNKTTSAIKQLENKMIAISNAKQQTSALNANQYDPYLLLNNQANNASILNTKTNQILSLDDYIKSLASNYTQNHITTSLQLFANQIIPNHDLMQKINSDPSLNNTDNYLTQGIHASDNPELNTDDQPKNQDTTFNLATLLQPVAYTSDQQQQAQNYIKYATHLDFQRLYNQIDFSSVQTALQSLKKQSAKQQLINKVMNAPAVQQLVLYLRSLLANQSVALNAYNHLLAERIPVSGLGSEADLKDNNGNTIKDASPLQVQQYIAEQAHDKKWYRHVQAASPTTVQRETLITLAQIERQNYEAYQQRELLLAVLANMQMQNTQVGAQSGLAMINTANEQIKRVIQSSTPQKAQQMDDSNS